MTRITYHSKILQALAADRIFTITQNDTLYCLCSVPFEPETIHRLNCHMTHWLKDSSRTLAEHLDNTFNDI